MKKTQNALSLYMESASFVKAILFIAFQIVQNKNNGPAFQFFPTLCCFIRMWVIYIKHSSMRCVTNSEKLKIMGEDGGGSLT